MRLMFALITTLVLAACSTPQKASRQVKAGEIDRKGIREVIKSHEKEILSCYDQVRRTHKNLEGSVIVDFDIDEGGKVVRAGINQKKSKIDNAELSNCLVRKFSSWTFPSPPEKQVVEVSYPLYFSLN